MTTKPRQTAPRLSRERLIQAALALIDAEGAQRLTVRRVAAALDVTPMALYWHFSSKDELLDGVGDTLAQRIDIPARPVTDPWDARLTELMHSLISALAEHPGAAEIAMQRMLYTDQGRKFVELGLRALHDAGLSDDDAFLVGRYTLRTAVSVASEPVFTGSSVPSERAAQLQREYDTSADTLSVQDFPYLHRMREHLSRASGVENYQHTAVKLLVDGIRAFRKSR